MFVNLFNSQYKNNPQLSFKGKDGSIKYLEKTVVKTFHPERKQEFQLEREFLSGLTRTNFPFSPKFIKADDNSIEMERVFGQTLLDFLPTATKSQLLWAKEQVFNAANALAKEGIFHKDLNRANVLVVKDAKNNPFKIVILDFADAKKVKSTDTAQLADDMMYRKHLTPILDTFLGQAK